MRESTPAARPSRHRHPARPRLTLDTLEPRHLLTTWGPLLTFPTFNQNGLIPGSQIAYNQFAPIDPATGQRSYLGCVAVAETQLAYFWQFPQSLTLTANDRYTSLPESPSAISLDSGALAADFPDFTALNAALATLHYDGNATEQAMLGFAVGILARENYSSVVSSALLTATTLGRLGFHSATNAFSWTTAKPTVISNLQHHQPVIAQISGASGVHVVILDGYDDTANTFHANFGLGGTGDGWYTAPSFAGAGGTFTQIDSLILNISPTLPAPTLLTATQGTFKDHVQLSWAAVPQATGYQVWRSTTDDPATASLISTTLHATTFSDTTGLLAQPYVYWVKAESSSDESTFSTSAPGYRALAPTRLKFTQGPTHTVAGQTLSTLTVTIQDAHGNTIPNSTAPVTLSLRSGPAGAILAGTLTVQATQGIATFTDLQLTKSGTYRLQATAGALTKALSTSFTITPDLTTQQLFVPTLPPLTVGKSLALKVSLVDQFQNVIPRNFAPITLATSDPLIPPLTRTTRRGIATFPSLSFTHAGNVTLSFSSSATPAPLDAPLTVIPGTTLLSKPRPASSYTVGKPITLSTTLTSTAPRAIPFTATATLRDQNDQSLGTALVSSTGVARFTLTAIAPGTYTCTITYPGDANHIAGVSPTFTLRIFA